MNDILKIILFALATAGIVNLSRRSLVKPRSHGFYRFFAFESILALILLNVNFWFKSSGVWHQVISWILLVAALVPLAFGMRDLHQRAGRADGRAAGHRDQRGGRRERSIDLITIGIIQCA